MHLTKVSQTTLPTLPKDHAPSLWMPHPQCIVYRLYMVYVLYMAVTEEVLSK